MSTESTGKPVYNVKNPYIARLKHMHDLTAPGAVKHTAHFEIDLTGSGLEYTPGDSLAVLRRRKWTIIIVVLVVLALGAVMSYRKSPVYEASASLLLKAASQNSVLAETTSIDPERRVQNEAELLRGSRTAGEVESRLGFGAGVSVAAGGDSDVIEITASASDPERAALVANTYAEAHRDLRQQDALESLSGARQEVQLQIDDIDQNAAQLAQQIADLQTQRFNTPDPVVQVDLDKAQAVGLKPGDVRRQAAVYLAAVELSDVCEVIV